METYLVQYLEPRLWTHVLQVHSLKLELGICVIKGNLLYCLCLHIFTGRMEMKLYFFHSFDRKLKPNKIYSLYYQGNQLFVLSV